MTDLIKRKEKHNLKEKGKVNILWGFFQICRKIYHRQ